MKWRISWALVALLPGCGKAPEVAGIPEAKAPPPPAARVVPVETHPFEDGYETGYAQGLGTGRVGAKMPPVAAAEELARAAAGQDAERTERWQRGFVDGYLDGFRKVVTGQK